MIKKITLWSSITLMWCAVLQAQPAQVSGRVTGMGDDEPLPGVNVLVEGTSAGTITDLDGRYTLGIPDGGSTLVFSYVGYVTESVNIGSSTVIDMELSPDLLQLNELVVIGYGLQEKKDISSAIGTVDADAIGTMPVSGFDQAMQGLAAGLNVSSPSGAPGTAANVNIRGATSITASSQPLYIIDGIPVQPQNNSALNSNIQPINPLAEINPSDIESISVLKDAASASIYGTRGANGVIIITTKRGNTGKSKVNLNYYAGVQEIAHVPEMMNSSQWIEFLNVAAANDGRGENYWSDIIGDPDDPELRNVDVYDELFRSAFIQNADLSVRGGNEKTQLYVSGNFYDQDGIQLGQAFKRYSLRLNADHQVSSSLKIGTSIQLSRSNHERTINENDEYGVIINAQAWDPTAPLRREDGSYTNPFSYYGWWALENPMVIANEYVNDGRTNRVLSSVFGEWEIVPGLQFRSSLAIDYNTLTEESFTPAGYNESDIGTGTFATWEEFSYLTENTLNYSKLINKHSFNALLGFSVQGIDQVFSSMTGTGFPTNALTKIALAANITAASSNGRNYGLVSYLSRFNYDYDNKYIISATVRADGSSRFGANNKYGVFPSTSVAWRMSEEPFFENLRTTVNDFKLRASYGITGNEAIGTAEWRGRWRLNAPYNEEAGSLPSELQNPDLSWERTTQWDIGFDLTLFDSRVNVTSDYFYKYTNDLLLQADVPGTTGFPSMIQNVGEVMNRGLELSINTVNYNRNGFRWNTGFNITWLENEIQQLVNDGELISRNFILKEGESLSTFNLIRFLGVDPSTGDAVFEDYNGDGIINQDDRQIVGNAQPNYFGGFTNTFSYKGFSLFLLFQYTHGNDIFNQSRHAYENYGSLRDGIPYGNYNTRSLDYWRQPGDITAIPRPSLAGPEDANAQWQRFSTQYLEDGSYLRFKTAKLSYQFDGELTDRLGLSSLGLYVQGQNLLTWTNYMGFDPEVSTNTSSQGSLNTQQGEDFGTLGQARTFTVGINIEF
jgi:TonB-linked SusC/RagA family outer membrane protein